MKTIALFGYYGVGNLGDEAVVAALIRNIRQRQPEARIIGISLNPGDTTARHGIEALPIRRTYVPRPITTRNRIVARLLGVWQVLFLKLPAEAAFTLQSLSALGGIDMIVVAGSGGVYDWWHGPWSHPFTHFRWALLASLRRTQMVYLSVGAGPFKTVLGKYFFRFALSHAAYRSFRDSESLHWMDVIGMTKPAHLFPDMAFDIAVRPAVKTPADASRRMRVGVNALPFFHVEWSALYDTGAMEYATYIDALAEFVDWLLRHNCEVVFFHSQIGDQFLDKDIIAALERKTTAALWRPYVRCSAAQSFEELLDHIDTLDIVVASRFHAILFSYLLKKPVLGVSYHHKVDDLMTRMGQQQYILDIRTLSSASLIGAFDRLAGDIREQRWPFDDAIFERYRADVKRQFDTLFSQSH
jgi:polysaccharide pyruvyl transferase WcaK-like protein